MGCSFQTVCLACHHQFISSSGGGFSFDELHCDVCGSLKTVLYEKHKDYVELKQRYFASDSKPPERVNESSPVDPVLDPPSEVPPEDVSLEMVESYLDRIVGRCECGGQFRLYAPIRCPKCRSDEVKTTVMIVLYD